MDDQSPRKVACTLAEGEVERYEQIRPTLVSTYTGVTELDDGYMLTFAGVDEVLLAIAKFVSLELQCCSFADFEIEVSPPYDETCLSITGPEGTKMMFGDGLVELLETESSEF